MDTSKIRVTVRKRPFTEREKYSNQSDIINCLSPETLCVTEQRQKVDLTKYTESHSFTFDQVYNDIASNEDIYLDAVQPLVSAAFNRTKVTCFAYGQTGSGKTFTMMGEAESPGLYLLATHDIFKSIEQSFHGTTVHVSFYEIYCSKVLDLLNERAQCTMREDKNKRVNIVGLTESQVDNAGTLMELIECGLEVRASGVTSANDDSSRSHAILTITLKNAGKGFGRISFIDLAGCERGSDTINNCKQTRIDGAEINKSLLALKECIRAMDQDKAHLPFRGSKLTQILKDSFVGNSKTLMIANISPSSSASEDTLNTLRYADRVKEIRHGGKARSRNDQLMLPRKQTPTPAQRTQNAKENERPYTAIEYAPKPTEYVPKPRQPPQAEQQNIENLRANHENLIKDIITQEEQLISSHREHVDLVVGLVKQDMQVLSEVDKPGSDIYSYINSVEGNLDYKSQLIKSLKLQVANFRKNLKEEARLNQQLSGYSPNENKGLMF